MRFSILFLVCMLFLGCKPPEVADSQGRVFVKVQERKLVKDNLYNAELWQIKGKVGKTNAFYIRLMGEPPTFTETK